MIGKILRKKYKIIEELGSGGMAKVYKAISLKSGNFYAVKVLRAEFIKNSEFVERFNIEFENAKVLKHQNIVAVRYSGQEDDIKYIIMDYIDGITLKDYMQKNGVIEYKVAIKIAMDVCSALEYAHSKDIIHRDIKPQNILITRDNIVKVMDFGISKALTSGTITMHGSTMGSVQYFSPEQARGSYAGASSDLYSLGVTLYEMVTGVLPFQGKAPIDIALKHLREKPIEPKMRNSKIPEGLNILILKAMKKDSENRYQKAKDMFNDLKGLFKNPQGNFIKITADKKVTKLKTNDKKPADNSSWRISSIIIVVILIIAIMTAISIILKYK